MVCEVLAVVTLMPVGGVTVNMYPLGGGGDGAVQVTRTKLLPIRSAVKSVTTACSIM